MRKNIPAAASRFPSTEMLMVRLMAVPRWSRLRVSLVAELLVGDKLFSLVDIGTGVGEREVDIVSWVPDR